MTKEEERELREQLARLQQEHRDLDAAISALQGTPGSDVLQVQRLKQRNLYLRDRISFIADQLTPYIIAGTRIAIRFTRYSLLATRYSLLATRYSLLATRYSLLAT